MSWEPAGSAPASVAGGDDFGEGPSTNGHNAGEDTNAAVIQAQTERLEHFNKARAAGWTEGVALDYKLLEQLDGADYAGAGKVYEWHDEYGDVGPEVPQLEEILFGGEFQMRKGDHADTLDAEVTVKAPNKIIPFKQWEDAGLHPIVLRNIQLARYDVPTPIQRYLIPVINQGSDVLAIAQTGSGKTAAYMIPIISKLMGKAKKLAAARPDTSAPGYNAKIHRVRAEPLVVVVVPTRELAIQLFDEARRMCYRSMLRPCVVYGGLPTPLTFDQLGAGCDVLIATPGRLCDLMDKPHIMTMSRVKYTVIDEADEMLAMDWSDELEKIMGGGDTNDDADHVYVMTSATCPKDIRGLANEYLASDFYSIRIGTKGITAHKNIRQNVVWVDGNAKREAVYDLLMSGGKENVCRTMIFCNAKGAVDELDDYLFNKQLPTTSIHSDRNQREREDSMRAFRTGKSPILIATGVSARGWDVQGCGHVINYDLPSTQYGGITEYIHRIGRTGRMGNLGLATSFYNDRNEDLGEDLVKVLMDCECEVPDFLQQYVPEDGKVDFDDDTDDEEEGGEDGADVGGFGSGGFGTEAATNGDDDDAAVSSAWGAGPDAPKDEGFSAVGGGAEMVSAW